MTLALCQTGRTKEMKEKRGSTNQYRPRLPDDTGLAANRPVQGDALDGIAFG